jgi:hypothetical protein
VADDVSEPGELGEVLEEEVGEGECQAEEGGVDFFAGCADEVGSVRREALEELRVVDAGPGPESALCEVERRLDEREALRVVLETDGQGWFLMDPVSGRGGLGWRGE